MELSDKAVAARVEFARVLTAQYTVLFETDAAYRVVKEKNLPQDLARKMMQGLIDGTADKSGAGVVNACKELGVKLTYKAIQKYLNTGEK